MTMRLTIKNEDQSRTAVVTTYDGDLDSRNKSGVLELPPGKDGEVWIHSTRHVVVEEKQGE